MTKNLLLACIAGLALSVALPATDALAQDEFDEEERTRSRRGRKAPTAREIHHGVYIKATFGSVGWFGTLGAVSSFGTAAGFEFGYDVMDQLGMTLSITGTFYQGINNGLSAEDVQTNGIAVAVPNITQGDFRSIGGLVGARLGFNPGKRKVRRWTIAVDIKGGIYFSPALRDAGDYSAGLLQQSPGALILPGFGIEHFTRLSHFSFGIDLHVPLIVGTPAGFVAGLDVTPFLKYTF
jgi:hypothetical protein